VGGEMSYNFNDETPIYLQIIEHIKTQIISEKYMPKQKLPSVRELSFEFEVNPNTVQKALSELENMGLIFTERTNGKFVTDNEALIADIKKQTMQKMIDDFYMSMEKIGIDRERVLQILIDERS
jgi:GntR family transcriptional regulator